MAKTPPKNPPKGFTAPTWQSGTVPLPRSVMGGVPPVMKASPPARPVMDQAQLITALQTAAAHFDAGRLKPAAQIVERVLAFHPKNPDALHLLGLLMLEVGEVQTAQKLILEAISVMRTPMATLFVSLGNVHRAQGNYDEAMAAYAKALERKPDDPDALINRGLLNKLAKKPELSLADYLRVMEVQPQRVVAYTQAAENCIELGQFREAIAFCEKGLAYLKDVPATYHVLMGNIYERLSELDRALEHIEIALSMEPDHLEGRRLKARILRRQGGDLTLARQLLETADLQKAGTTELGSIHGELSQIAMVQGDYAASFHHAQKMNDASAKEAAMLGIDKATYLEQVETIISVLQPEQTRLWRQLADPAPQTDHKSVPVFLIGFPRSGTTLLDQVLDAHPDVQVVEEKPMIKKIKDILYDRPEGFAGAMAQMDEALRDELRTNYWNSLRAEGYDPVTKLVIDKLPLNIIHAPLITRIFPEAKLILALRHSADSVLSCFMQNFAVNASMANFFNIEDAAYLYHRVMTLWELFETGFSPRVHRVRYENVITDLAAEARPTLDFLELPWNDNVLDPSGHARRRGTIRTPSYAQVTRPLYTASMDRWRHYEQFLEPVMPLLEPHMKYFGYTR